MKSISVHSWVLDTGLGPQIIHVQVLVLLAYSNGQLG